MVLITTEEDEEVNDFGEHGLSEDSEEEALDHAIDEFEASELAHKEEFNGVAQCISLFLSYTPVGGEQTCQASYHCTYSQ